jgi:hypothetical protein
MMTFRPELLDRLLKRLSKPGRFDRNRRHSKTIDGCLEWKDLNEKWNITSRRNAQSQPPQPRLETGAADTVKKDNQGGSLAKRDAIPRDRNGAFEPVDPPEGANARFEGFD